MKISVITPYLGSVTTSQAEAFLADCKASVEAQKPLRTPFTVEHLVMPDSISDPKGVAAMRNAACRSACGDFFLFLDSDDYLGEDALGMAADTAAQHPGRIVALQMRQTWYKREAELPSAAKESEQDPHKNNENLILYPATVLGLLIPATLMEKEFDEKLKYYCDLPFLAGLLEKGEPVSAEGAVYYKRRHNDSVRYPALDQIRDKDRYAEFERACLTDGNASARQLMCPEVCGYIICKLTRGKHPEGLGWSSKDLGHAAAVAGFYGKEAICGSFTGVKRRILLRLSKGKTGSALRAAKLHVLGLKKKGLFGSALQWKWNIYKRIFRKFPVKKELFLFESFLGKSYGDSCRAIYEYMSAGYLEGGAANGAYNGMRGGRPIRFVWVIDNKDAHIPGVHKEVKPLSLKYFYYVARCGAWINNMRQPAWYEKRDGVIFLECWHGTPLKKLVFDMEDVHSASPEYKMTFYKQSRIWDWLVSDNRFSTEAFKSAFLFPQEKILELGYPRNDLLYAPDRDSRAERVKERLKIPKDRKVVLYAPTWRDDDFYAPGQYKFDLPLDLKVMERLKDRYFFVLRTHYFIADHLTLTDAQKEYVTDCSRYNDIGELYLISDVLITDYSSVFFDYANLRRPILFYVYDFEKYRDTLRGFYFDMESRCPGPLLFTSDQVADALENIDGVVDEYADKYSVFLNDFCYLDDGHAARRITEAVFKEEAC